MFVVPLKILFSQFADMPFTMPEEIVAFLAQCANLRLPLRLCAFASDLYVVDAVKT
jgi:hypothetical protein